MYGLLLLMFAKGNGYKPGQLIGFLGDCHIYNNHLSQVEEYLKRNDTKLPNVKLSKGLQYNEKIVVPLHKDIKLENYKFNEPIKAPLAT